jgi:hypothetical protein
MPIFTIDEDAPVLVEFTPRPGLQQVSFSAEDLIEKSAAALDSAMNTIYQMAQRVNATIGVLPDRPDQVEVAFGLKLDAEGGAVVAKAGIEAAINVKLVWESKK